MDQRISSVVLRSIDRPDIGSVSFALYTDGPFIMERMDGWAGISSINTAVQPYQLRNGSNVSNPNQIGGKLVSFLVHITGPNESETLKTINLLNGILQASMELVVIDNFVEYILPRCNLVAGSYNPTRKSPTLYSLEFVIASESAYRIRSEVSQKLISAAGGILSGGIIYPLFASYDDEVSYPDYTTPYVTITEVQQQKIVVTGNGDIYPYFYIKGTFYSATITLTDSAGADHSITLKALGAVGANNYHEWELDTESLETFWTTPNTYGAPNWNDTPVIDAADWFKLAVGQNIMKIAFNTGGTGSIIASWQEREL
jgi:hypothetical protein